ncbi:MAG: 30S ribosomal protein S6 [Dehalococcoidia bacterium]
MREYEFTIVVDLAVSEAGNTDASVEVMKSHVEGRGGNVLSVDHWGRRRMAYPINGAIDGDYLVTRIELPTDAVQPLNDALRIDERVYRHLLVRADHLPPPPPPREPRRRPEAESDTPPSREASAPAAPAARVAPPAPAAAPQAEQAPAASTGSVPPADSPADGVDPAPAAPESDTAPDEIADSPATVDGEQETAEQGGIHGQPQ